MAGILPVEKIWSCSVLDTDHRLAFRRLNCLLKCLEFLPGPACGAETISTAGCRSLFINNRWYPFLLVRDLEHSLELGLEHERSIRDRWNDANHSDLCRRLVWQYEASTHSIISVLSRGSAPYRLMPMGLVPAMNIEESRPGRFETHQADAREMALR